MLFSVIIPVYNVEHYLKDCLDSVLDQTYEDWEAICVDDGSTDNSRSILEEYVRKDSRFKTIFQENSGTAAARNAGLEAAVGDYIFFLDSDDWLELNALEILSQNINGEDVVCFSGRRFFEKTGSYNAADQLPEKVYSSGMDYYNENALLYRDFAFACVVLRVCNRSFLDRDKLLFDTDVSYEDNLWVPIMLYYAGVVKVISNPLYVYRVRAGSKMQEISLNRKKDLLKVANRLAAFFVPKRDFEKSAVYCTITHLFQMVFLNVSKGDRRELKRLCDWKLYRKVSRTKLRHRYNYVKNSIKCKFLI